MRTFWGWPAGSQGGFHVLITGAAGRAKGSGQAYPHLSKRRIDSSLPSTVRYSGTASRIDYTGYEGGPLPEPIKGKWACRCGRGRTCFWMKSAKSLSSFRSSCWKCYRKNNIAGGRQRLKPSTAESLAADQPQLGPTGGRTLSERSVLPLKTIEIDIPPLSQRHGDLVPLIIFSSHKFDRHTMRHLLHA